MFQPNARQMSAFNFPMIPFPFYHSKIRQQPSENMFKVVKNFDIFEQPKHMIKAQIVIFKEQPHVSVSKFYTTPANPNGLPTGKGIFMPVLAWHALCESIESINNELNALNKSSSVACMKFNIKLNLIYLVIEFCPYFILYHKIIQDATDNENGCAIQKARITDNVAASCSSSTEPIATKRPRGRPPLSNVPITGDATIECMYKI